MCGSVLQGGNGMRGPQTPNIRKIVKHFLKVNSENANTRVIAVYSKWGSSEHKLLSWQIKAASVYARHVHSSIFEILR